MPPGGKRPGAAVDSRRSSAWLWSTPLLLPALTGSPALCFALSMGELGATAMVYSADWTTLPSRIYALDDCGHQFVAAAVTAVMMMMMTTTLAILLVLSRMRTRADYR